MQAGAPGGDPLKDEASFITFGMPWFEFQWVLPSGKLTETLADGGWKTSFHWKLVIFRVYVYLPEGRIQGVSPLFMGVSWEFNGFKEFHHFEKLRAYMGVQSTAQLKSLSWAVWCWNCSSLWDLNVKPSSELFFLGSFRFLHFYQNFTHVPSGANTAVIPVIKHGLLENTPAVIP